MSHYCDETYADYIEQALCAKQELRCEACRETISVGHIYYDIEIVEHYADEDDEDDSDISETIVRCVRCQRIHEHLRELGRKHDMWPDEHLNCGEEYEEHWGNPPPQEIAELAFKSGGELQTPELQLQVLQRVKP